MYKLLVVDDEPIIVDGLYELFKEMKSYSLDVYKAYSGAEALEWLSIKKIDVVITDIKMPGMDGMQLLEKIRYNWPDCKVIFLTGHDEFEYIYMAISHDGVSYLLKTESYEKIVETVENYLEQIEKNLKDEELVQKAKTQLQKVLPILQNEFLTDLIDGTNWDISQQQLDELYIPLIKAAPVILIAGYLNEMRDKADTTRKSDYYAINYIAEKYLANYVSSAFWVYKGYMLWIVQSKKAAEGEYTAEEYSPYHMKGIMETVQAICRETLKLNSSFVISGKAVKWNEIAEGFNTLKAMFNYYSGSGMEAVLVGSSTADGEAFGQINSNKINQNIKFQLKKLEVLDSYLEQGKKEEFLNAFREIRGSLPELMNQTAFSFEVFYTLSLLFLSYMNRHGMTDELTSRIDYEGLTSFDRYGSMDEAFEYFENLSSHIFEIQNIEQEKRSVASVLRVQKYIQDNPGGDLSLSSLADMVYFNPKYLSRLFKQVTGANLSDYISEVRLNKVKELLQQNSLKVHKIAEYAGYFSAPCFTRFFKRATGKTPQEYRDSYLTGNQKC